VNPTRGCNYTWALLAPVLSLAATPLAAQTHPLDSALVVQVLREAVVAFRESSDSMRANDRFRGHLREISEAWEVEWDPEFVPRPPSPGEVIDSLIARGEIDGALKYADGHSPSSHFQLVRKLLEALAVRGLIDEALSVADSLGFASRGIYAVLDSPTPDSIGWRWKVDRIARFIRDEASDTVRASWDWGTLNYYLAEHDFAAAWARAGVWEPDSVTAWRLSILDLAFDQNLPTADSLFLDTYERARKIAEPEIRDPLLVDLEDLCEWKEISICDGLEFPRDQRPSLRSLRYEFERALAVGRFLEADELGRELRQLLSAVDYALIVSGGLGRADWPCVQAATCGRAYDSLLTVTLPELDRIAAENVGRTADSLNVRLAALWAGRDLARARTALDRIESPDARSLGLNGYAMAAHRWDRKTALEAFREVGKAGTVWLEGDFLHFMSWADTARAEEVLLLMGSGWVRMSARLEWAKRVRNSGRWQDARHLAQAALDEWDPSAEPMIGSRGYFWEPATYAEVIEWARSLRDPDDRAAALAALIGTMRRPGGRF
jgi:hypothetical protein